MRKNIVILTVAVLCIMLTSCSKNNAESKMDNPTDQSIESLFQTVCPAEEALEMAKKSGAVVFETKGCTSGKDVWDAFYQTASSGSPASVLCAHYYVLDKDHVSEELYEAEKDQYPKMFFYLVEYDGKEYSVKTRESTVEALDYQETFQYLLHLTGDAPPTALYTTYDNYVLVDDPTLTWEAIMAGEFSSQSGAAYKHCAVYTDYLGWK